MYNQCKIDRDTENINECYTGFKDIIMYLYEPKVK
jgi:hypothetical protein